MIEFKLKEFFVSDNTSLFLWLGTFALIIITFLLAFYKISSAPSSVALHYNVLVGVDLLGDKTRLYLVPTIAGIIAGINLLIALLLLRGNKFLRIVLAASSLLSAVVALWALLLLFKVN